MKFSRRFFYIFLSLCLLAGGFGVMHITQASDDPRQQDVAIGLIVKLKDEGTLATPSDLARLSPQARSERLARHEQRQSQRRDQLVRDASLAVASHHALDESHQVMRFQGAMRGAQLQEQLRRARQDPNVEYAEADVRIKRKTTTPNDTSYAASQWYLKDSVTYPSALNLPTAWDTQRGLASTVIAIVDTGIRLDHSDFDATRFVPGYDFVSDIGTANDGDGRDSDPSDPGDWITTAESTTSSNEFYGCDVSNSSWHGTFIAGILGAKTNNSTGIAAVNWNSKILPVRISGKCGAFLSDLLAGLRWAAGLSVSGAPTNANPAKIINLSFGGSSSCGSSYQSTVNSVLAAGSLLVVAAGNESTPLARPADCTGVMTVGAARQSGAKTDYSNYGSNVAVMAPGGASGQYIYSTSNSGTTSPVAGAGGSVYNLEAGTSFSAPLGAGVASLLYAQDTSQTPAQLIARIKAGSRAHTDTTASFPTCSSTVNTQTECSCTQAACGAGLLDAVGALAQVSNPAAVISTAPTATYASTVSLNGASSIASTGQSLTTYAWTQLAGTTVTLQNANTSTASFIAPSSVATLVFKLQITDSAAKTASVTTAVLVGAPVPASSGGGGGGGATSWSWALGLFTLLIAALWTRRQSTGRLRCP